MSTSSHDPKQPTERPRRRRGWGWLAVLIGLLIVAGIGAAVLANNDGSIDESTDQVQGVADDGVDAVTSAGDEALDTVTGEAPGAADSGVDAVTNAGDEALDTVTGAGDEALDTATNAADEARDAVTDDESTAPTAVQNDPLVKRLAKGRALPFVAGPWQRQSYRDGVFDRLSEATRARAKKVTQGDGFGIQIR